MELIAQGVVMDAEAAGPSNRGSRRRPQAEKRKMEECEGREGEAAGERNVVREVQGGRKRQRMSEIIGAGSWICRESYCGLSLPDQSSLERHYRGHCAQEEEKLVRLRVKRRREEGEEEQGGLRERRRLVLDRLSERRELRRETRLRDHRQSLRHVSRECPLCRREVEYNLMEDHLALCLRVVAAPEEEDDESDEVVVVDEDGWEEYEWAGQRRVRSSSLRLARGQDCSSNQVTIQRTEEEEELDILGNDEDEEQKGENDQVARGSSVETPFEVEAPSNAACPSLTSENSGTRPLDNTEGGEGEENILAEDSKDSLETAEEKGEMCKICMSSYSRPLVSTSCWHVHCQTCWLRALGAARVCPQCKAPVKPDDLSRVFL